LFRVKKRLQKQNARESFGLSRAIGKPWLDVSGLDRGYLYHAHSVHTAATTGHNVHVLNIDQNGPIWQVLILISDNSSG
jgi:hypothetical protein